MIIIQRYKHYEASKAVCHLYSSRNNDNQFNNHHQIFTATAAAALALAAAEDQTDIEVKDKDIKEELGTSDTKATNDDNTAKDREQEIEEESNNNTRARETGLEEDNVMIDDTDTYSSDDDNNDDDGDVPFKLPFDNIIPFPQALHYYFMQCTLTYL